MDYINGKPVVIAYRVYSEYLSSQEGHLYITPKAGSYINLGNGTGSGSQTHVTTSSGFCVDDTSGNVYLTFFPMGDCGVNMGIMPTNDRANNNLIFCSNNNVFASYGLSTPSTNPILHVASGTAVGTSTTERVTISHETTYGKVWSLTGIQLVGGADGVETRQVAALDADAKYNGETATLTIDASVGVNLKFGSLLTLASDGELVLADADSVDTAPAMYMALGASTGSQLVLKRGYIRENDWNWTPGNGVANLLYLSTDPSTTTGITQTAPSGSSDVVQIIGHVVNADVIYFDPSLDYVVVS